MQAPSGIKAEFVRTRSLLDLARLAGHVQNSAIYALASGKGYRLLFPAEKVGKNTVVFCFDADRIGGYGVYANQDGESFEFRESVREAQDLQSRRIRIIELDGDPFAAPAPKDDISMLKLRHYADMVKGVAYRSAAEEEPAQSIYRFDAGGKAVVCSISSVDHETQVLVHAELDDGKQFSFFRYNYTQDSVTKEAAPGRNTDFYVPVINLAEPFRFFRGKK